MELLWLKKLMIVAFLEFGLMANTYLLVASFAAFLNISVVK
jgi:hypothetical protein